MTLGGRKVRSSKNPKVWAALIKGTIGETDIYLAAQ
jgi:hypothetical protein